MLFIDVKCVLYVLRKSACILRKSAGNYSLREIATKKSRTLALTKIRDVSY